MLLNLCYVYNLNRVFYFSKINLRNVAIYSKIQLNPSSVKYCYCMWKLSQYKLHQCQPQPTHIDSKHTYKTFCSKHPHILNHNSNRIKVSKQQINQNIPQSEGMFILLYLFFTMHYNYCVPSKVGAIQKWRHSILANLAPKHINILYTVKYIA